MQNYIIPKTASSCNIKVSTKYSDTISPSTCFLWTTFFPWASIINFLKMTGGRLFIAPMIVETDAHALIFPSIRWHRMSLPAFKQNHTTSDRWTLNDPSFLFGHRPGVTLKGLSRQWWGQSDMNSQLDLTYWQKKLLSSHLGKRRLEGSIDADRIWLKNHPLKFQWYLY